MTGIVGPTTDDDRNPIGVVYFAASRRGRPSEVMKKEFGEPDRDSMLFDTVGEALDLPGRMIEPERTNGE